MGQWRHSSITDPLSTTLPLARRVYALAQAQRDPTLMVGACTALGLTLYCMGDFGTARQYTTRGLEIWSSGAVRSQFEEVDFQPVACLSWGGLVEWHCGETVNCRALLAEAASLATALKDMHGLAVALECAAMLGYLDQKPAEADRVASALIELATRQHFAYWLAVGTTIRGWARSASGEAVEGLTWIEDGIRAYRATGATRGVPVWLALKAEALHLAARTPEALETIQEAEAFAERSGVRWRCADLYRLRGVFLAALGAEEAQVEAAFGEAIATAQQQKSVALLQRAEASYAEYHSRVGDRPGNPDG
jgi:tetratricopeptide (TPR) repeat protein